MHLNRPSRAILATRGFGPIIRTAQGLEPARPAESSVTAADKPFGNPGRAASKPSAHPSGVAASYLQASTRPFGMPGGSSKLVALSGKAAG